jgi:hypothetical protein
MNEGQIAVNRKGKGPMPVEASQDLSVFFVRDMSGNGKEWTRTRDNPEAANPEKVDFVQLKKEGGGASISLILRGRDYEKETPLLYKHLDSVRDAPGQETLDADPHPSIAFRVVIEP